MTLNIIDILRQVSEGINRGFFYTPPVYPGSKSFLVDEPLECITARNKEELDILLDKIDALAGDRFGILILSYEAGYFFDESFGGISSDSREFPIGVLLIYDEENVRIIDSRNIDYRDAGAVISGSKTGVHNIRPNIDKNEYIEAIKSIKREIYRGNTYQTNFTFKINFDFEGKEDELFLKLIFNQSAQFSVFLNINEHFIISSSPELFFQTRNNNILARPMKGTRARGKNIEEDSRALNDLSNSEKDKAENIMIVDLIRNDIGRIAQMTSVSVSDLYKLEKYETVIQMTSTVESRLNSTSLKNTLRNIFPCGSITGAPKISTMKLIRKLEKESRGLYTGTIGLIGKNTATFNVAIRTAVIKKESKKGEIGIGSGVVWDSIPEHEYEESMLKAKFLTEPGGYFELFETMLLENNRILYLEDHVERLEKSAEYFLFYFDKTLLFNEINKILQVNYRTKKIIRVNLNKWGDIAVRVKPYEETTYPVKVRISDRVARSGDRFLYFKTTIRDLYDSEGEYFRSRGYFDVLFFNEEGNLTEGSITNIFIKRDSMWHTPELGCGVLDGCYRKHFIIETGAEEGRLTRSDILNADRIVLVNSVRKAIEVGSVYTREGKFWESNL